MDACTDAVNRCSHWHVCCLVWYSATDLMCDLSDCKKAESDPALVMGGVLPCTERNSGIYKPPCLQSPCTVQVLLPV